MVFDFIVVVIFVGAVLKGLKLFALIKAALIILILTVILQFIPSNITDLLVNGSKLYGVISPLAMRAYAVLKPLIAKINLATIKTWLVDFVSSFRTPNPTIPTVP